MLKSVRVSLLAAGAVAAAMLVPGLPVWALPAGPHAKLCAAGKPAVLARVSGFKAPTGTVSVKLYASNSSTFLERGRYLRKVEVPVRSTGPIDVCVPVPAGGKYALAVRHEVRGEKSRSDGGGFSGNPSVSLVDVAFKRKPPLNKVSFQIDRSTKLVPVTLKYLQGGSIRAVS